MRFAVCDFSLFLLSELHDHKGYPHSVRSIQRGIFNRTQYAKEQTRTHNPDHKFNGVCRSG